MTSPVFPEPPCGRAVADDHRVRRQVVDGQLVGTGLTRTVQWTNPAEPEHAHFTRVLVSRAFPDLVERGLFEKAGLDQRIEPQRQFLTEPDHFLNHLVGVLRLRYRQIVHGDEPRRLRVIHQVVDVANVELRRRQGRHAVAVGQDLVGIRRAH